MKSLTETSTFLRACSGLPTERTPIWLMRQAGRYMADYRAIRAKHPMLDVINTPELAAEVTLQPINAFGLDAAIIFADILPILIGMGLELEFVTGKGPVIHNPISRPYEIDILATPPAEAHLEATLEAIRLVSVELTPHGVPVIGFAGAPFTLASYAIEGGGSKTYTKVKSVMLNHPSAWKRLMEKLVTVVADYLLKQAAAGASALQVFDSWVGLALSEADYKRYVLPYTQLLFEKLARAGVPTIYFSTGTAAYLPLVARCGADVIGVDWRIALDRAWELIGHDRPIQGNLDPAALLAPWREVQFQTDRIFSQAAGRPGHIFNLGHGIFKETDPDQVRRLVDYVHQKTAKPQLEAV